MKLNINNKAVKEQTDRLRTLHRSALPNAIRNTLNEAALDVKKNTMPESVKKSFIERSPTFFKANSKVDFATGYNVNSMSATVGFFENKLINGTTNYSIKDLEEQEDGGTINMKTFIPTVHARKGKTKKGLVKPNFRLNKIREKGLINANKLSGKNERQKYLIAANMAGVGGFVIYKRMLWRINSLRKKSKVERTPIYSVSKGRNIKVKNTQFMKLASLKTANKMEGYYLGHAKKQIDRLVKR